MGRMRLLKLLYLAERTALGKHGRPLYGGRYMSFFGGPLSSDVYDLIKYEGMLGKGWADLIRTVEYPEVALVKNEPVALDRLSEAEIDVIREIHEEFGSWTDDQIFEYVHNPKNVPEFKRPPIGRRTNILVSEVLRGVKKSAAEIAEIEASLRDILALNSLSEE